MANNAQKLNYGVNDARTANKQSAGRIQDYPKDLPASVVSIDKTNTIMTLKFETQGTALGPWTLPNVTMPLLGSEYIRFPIKPASGQQPGDKGVLTSASANLGNISGLGASTPANFTYPGNLAPLVFMPTGNENFTPTDDQTALMGYGPTGTIHRDTNKKAKHVVHPTSGVTSSTGAQGQTGPTSNPTYNMTHVLHPQNGWLAKILDSVNGTHQASLVPSGGSGVIGWLASVFGGSHKHQIDNNGHQLTSSAKVNVTAPTTNINSSQTNISGNTSITGILSALGGMFSGGSGGGGGGGGGIDSSGNVTGASVNVTGAATANTVLTGTYTIAALIAAYPPTVPANKGLRASVYDSNGVPSFLHPLDSGSGGLGGGGSNFSPAVCDGVHWVAG